MLAGRAGAQGGTSCHRFWSSSLEAVLRTVCRSGRLRFRELVTFELSKGNFEEAVG